MGKDLPHGGRLESAVDHAVPAPAVSARPVCFPPRLFHKLGKRRVVGVGNEVAGRLPAEGVAGRAAPGGAGHLPLSLQKIEVERGARHGEPAEQAAHLPELFRHLFLLQENVVGNALVAECGGDKDAVHAKTL